MKKMLMLGATVTLLAACAGNYQYGDDYTRADINHDYSLTRAEYDTTDTGRILGDRGWREMDIDGSGAISPMEYRRHPNQNRNN